MAPIPNVEAPGSSGGSSSTSSSGSSSSDDDDSTDSNDRPRRRSSGNRIPGAPDDSDSDGPSGGSSSNESDDGSSDSGGSNVVGGGGGGPQATPENEGGGIDTNEIRNTIGSNTGGEVSTGGGTSNSRSGGRATSRQSGSNVNTGEEGDMGAGLSDEQASAAIGRFIVNNPDLIDTGAGDDTGRYTPDDLVVRQTDDGRVISLTDEARREQEQAGVGSRVDRVEKMFGPGNAKYERQFVREQRQEFEDRLKKMYGPGNARYERQRNRDFAEGVADSDRKLFKANEPDFGDNPISVPTSVSLEVDEQSSNVTFGNRRRVESILGDASQQASGVLDRVAQAQPTKLTFAPVYAGEALAEASASFVSGTNVEVDGAERATKALTRGSLSAANLPAAALTVKNATDYGVEARNRLEADYRDALSGENDGLPVGQNTRRLADDTARVGEQLAEQTYEDFKANPLEVGARAAGGLAVGFAAGTAASRVLPGKLGGSDISGRAAQLSVRGAKRGAQGAKKAAGKAVDVGRRVEVNTRVGAGPGALDIRLRNPDSSSRPGSDPRSVTAEDLDVNLGERQRVVRGTQRLDNPTGNRPSSRYRSDDPFPDSYQNIPEADFRTRFDEPDVAGRGSNTGLFDVAQGAGAVTGFTGASAGAVGAVGGSGVDAIGASLLGGGVKSGLQSDLQIDQQTDLNTRVDTETAQRLDLGTRQDQDTRQDLDLRPDTRIDTRNDIEPRSTTRRKRDLPDLDGFDGQQGGVVSGLSGDEQRYEFRTLDLL